MTNKIRNMEGVLLVLLVNLIRVCDHTQGVHVSLTLQPQTVSQGDSLNITCMFSDTLTSDFSFANLKWFHNGEKIALYDKSFKLTHTEYTVNYYTFSMNDNHTCSVLEIPAVNFKRDSGNYTCLVQFDEPGSTFKLGEKTVRVLPTKSSMHLSDENGLLADGGNVTIEQRNKLHVFFLNVTGTRPKTSINCYLGEERLPTWDSTTGGGGLFNTTIIFLISSSTENHNKRLKCIANTSDSNVSLSVQVTVHVDASMEGFSILSIVLAAGIPLAVEGVVLFIYCYRSRRPVVGIKDDYEMQETKSIDIK